MEGIEFIDEKDALKVLDNGIKNKWRFAWLKEVDTQGERISTWCRKIKKEGLCFCIVCNTTINYSNNGKKVLFKHSKFDTHKKIMRAQKLTQTVPGAEPVIASSSISDRVADQKAVVTAFLSEKLLPLSLAPDIVELSKFLAKDKSALSKLKMSRTSATYITTHGTAKCLKEELVSKLKGNFFSLNIDEATNNAMNKIINVFVRFFDDDQNMIVTDHLASRKENISTAKNIFTHVSDILKKNGLNHSQIISCLLDNCNTMRGCKAGLETLLRKSNPKLLDIHGDTVHIVHNAAKKFFSHFEGYIEGIVSDIYYDIQDSPKAKEYFGEIQSLLYYENVLNVIRFIDNRFLQILTVCERFFKLNDALKTYYFGYLPDEKKEIEQPVLDEIYNRRNVSPEEKDRIKLVQDLLAKQSLKNANAERKNRILTILFHSGNRYFFLLQFYRGIARQFGSYVKLFQHDKPMIHLLHEEIFSLCHNFLSFFIKPEFLPKIVKDMKELDFKDPKLQYGDRFLNFGKFAVREMLDSQNKVWAKHFYMNLRNAYVNTTEYLLQKLPLDNNVLACFSALNPNLRKKSTTLIALQKLADALPQVVSNKALLFEEIRLYTSDPQLDELEATGVFHKPADKLRIDLDWWAHVFNIQHEGSSKYQLLSVFVKALLTPFSGPLVEGSFNIMDDIVTEDRSVLTVENYEAISTIKYNLRRRKMKAIELQPSISMRRAIQTAHTAYQHHLSEKKLKKTVRPSVLKSKSSKTENKNYSVPSTSTCSSFPKDGKNTTNISVSSTSKHSDQITCVKKAMKRPAEVPIQKPLKALKPSKITNFFQIKTDPTFERLP
jgi:hypothetical protein